MSTQEARERMERSKARRLEIRIAAHEEAAEAILRLSGEYKEAAGKSNISEFKTHAYSTASVLTTAADGMTKLAEMLKGRRGKYAWEHHRR